MKSVPSVVWTFKVYEQDIYEANQLDMGVIWYVALESKIQESRGFKFSTKVASVRIL